MFLALPIEAIAMCCHLVSTLEYIGHNKRGEKLYRRNMPVHLVFLVVQQSPTKEHANLSLGHATYSKYFVPYSVLPIG